MTIQSILSTASPSNGTLDLSVSQTFAVLTVRGWYGWSFDCVLNSSDAAGSVSIFTQCNNPLTTSVLNQTPVYTITVTGGHFSGGDTVLTVDSNFAISKAYCMVLWQGTGTGTLQIRGDELMY